MMMLVSGATKTVRRHAGDPHLGQLFRPGNGNLPGQMPWAADNGAFAGFREDAFLRMLDRISGYPGCMWVAAPDVVADSKRTIEKFHIWSVKIRERGMPVALVAQDGLIPEECPWSELDGVFIGGTTHWKLGPEARVIAKEALARGKRLHMGRVNSLRRVDYAAALGCQTFDGTNFSRYGDLRIPWMLQHLRVKAAQLSLWENLK